MTHLRNLIFVVALTTLTGIVFAQVLPQDFPNGKHLGPPLRVGAEHRDIADSSPIASVIFSQPISPIKLGEAVKLHVIILNKSDQYITGIGPLYFLDVRDSDGKLAPETEFGCREHFFSSCHSNKGYATGPGSSFAPHSKQETDDPTLTYEYNLTKPGVYTVVGYVCGIKESNGCFKSNTITITIQ